MELQIDQIIIRDDLYPRLKKDPVLVQKYTSDLEVLPPIEVNQRNELIDGWHRLTAYRTAGVDKIPVIVTETKSDVETLALAIARNAKHGQQLSSADKKSMAKRLFSGGAGLEKDKIAEILSVTPKTVSKYLSEDLKQIKEEQNRKILEMYLTCHTQEEIAEEVGLPQQTVADKLKVLPDLDKCSKSVKLSALFEDEFTPPLYNVWRFSKSSNNVTHFGNSEQTIVENLLYLYTKPFDIVVDPFGGGGSTLDVCRKRFRRCWISDRKPIPAREHEIRKHDIVTDGIPPLYNRWSDVSLTYLDPPYWRQAAGEYSEDGEDLANQSLDEFYENISKFITNVAQRQSKGVIALLIQPTQWRADDRKFTDHVFDLVSLVGTAGDRLELENRVSCPYNSEQYNAQMVNWAKENKKLLVLTRELVIWRLK